MDRAKPPPRPTRPAKEGRRLVAGAEPTFSRESFGRALLGSSRLLEDVLVARLAARGSEARAAHTRLLPFVDAEGTRLTTLAARTGVTKQAVGQLVEELAADGLLVREADPEDGRAKRVKLLPRGKKALADIVAALESIEAELGAHLGPARAEALGATLVDALGWLEAARASR